ncbi:hypothetical protein VSP20_08535 [Myroides phaeus]|uniref:hypothetical protein n=1 Tax=Myroides phaeus TaxID=702745 RepID=UPI002DC064B8|nr:hypothetical protein [Myroides phaeus]MEC4117015.1 hypothetical protein [Myroides phaeus]
MDVLCRSQFFIDLGIDVLNSKHIVQLQREYNFSEDCYRYLLANESLSNVVDLCDIGSHREQVVFCNSTIIEINEESIFSPYVFFFAREGMLLIGEVLVGEHKGEIVSIVEDLYCDIDSLEELLEDLNISITYAFNDENRIIKELMKPSLQVFTLLEKSFEKFIK